MERILITGSNRGIGLELVRQYLKRDNTHVFATCRTPDAAAELQKLAAQYADRLQIIALEVTSADSIAASVAAVKAQTDGLDILINNAAINPETEREQTFGKLDAEAMLHVLNVNAVAPIMVAQAYADLLRNGNNPRLINVSSGAGSLERQANSRGFTYQASKAALNMFSRSLANSLSDDGVITIMLNPGWVITDMGGPNANLQPAESALGILKVVDNLTAADNNTFLQWDGATLPW